MQQQPGLERIEESGADQAVAEQILFGAGETVGAGQQRSPAGPGGGHHGDLPGQGGQHGDDGGGHVPGPERGDDEAVEAAVEAAGRGPQQLAVVAEGEDDQAGAHRPGRAGRRHGEPSGGAGQQPRLAFDEPPDRPR